MIKKYKHRFLSITALLVIGTFILAIGSCTYDKAELLYPPNTCDTATVTYSVSIVPILSANCTTCHGGTLPAGGMDLSIYSVVKAQVDNGRLWGAVSQTAGYKPMPKNSDKLNDCNLNKIKLWILAGAPNN
jgi:mono/diheme cytochrome c family protein